MKAEEAFAPLKQRALAEWQGLQESSRPLILVGTATCGQAAGAQAVLEAVREATGRLGLEADIMEVGCIGLCYIEPLLDIVKPGRPRISYSNMTPKLAAQVIEDYLVRDNPRPDLALAIVDGEAMDGIPRLFDLPMLKPQVRIVLRNCGYIDPKNIYHYIARGGYSGFLRALSMPPKEVIDEMKKSGLRGRGGAGFPTGQKWEFCRNALGDEKYIICNADEGDPGAFMNRSLLEGDPHSVLEGMLIGAYAIGASEGYIYCRAEYPLAVDRITLAIHQMEECGLLGDDILGSGLSFRLKLRQGAGAFVCGEETALMASVEGRRGMPRPKPPFPANSGLWAKPTNINNVETWGNTSIILQKGADWYASFGVPGNTGTKTFSLVGKVVRTGLIEVPLGLTLRQIIYDVGGGIVGGKAFKAVQTGGPSGGCLPASLLDRPVNYETLAAAGSIMGSGGMVTADEDTCMVDLARFFLSFTYRESCGKCPPCRVGTRQMLHILERITRGQGEAQDLDHLQEIGQTMIQGSLCALGGTAPNPVLTTLRYFRDEYEAHILERRCPAAACKELTQYYILADKCQGCLICLRACPVQCIRGDKRLVHIIDQERCTKCSTCLQVCPFDAVARVSGKAIEVPSETIPVTAPPPRRGGG
ncbi:MAG: NADH-quinone oxidoreductase subunit NuoF [Chloroflexi bacterium]|nr:NADH-quinone oxidoreductase subunit NuoF [Chloroflexota bacterium]